MRKNMTADRSAEDMRNLYISKCGSSYSESPNPYVQLVTNAPALVLRADSIVAAEKNR